MKSGKIYVEKPESDDASKKDDRKKPNKKEPITISRNPNPRANENIKARPDSKNNQHTNNNQVGSEITDGEDG